MGRIGELLVILAIVFLLFGSRRLRDFGSDLGAAIKGFKAHVGDEKSHRGDEKMLQQQAVTADALQPEKQHV